MKLNNRIFSRQTILAISKVTTFSKYKSMKTFFAMAKLRAEYEGKKKAFDLAEAEIALMYCDRDKEGKPIVGSRNDFAFTQLDMEKRKEFNAKHDELMEQEIELSIDVITVSAKDEPGLFNNEEMCPKCSERFKNEMSPVITPTDVAALFGMVEFIE